MAKRDTSDNGFWDFIGLIVIIVVIFTYCSDSKTNNNSDTSNTYSEQTGGYISLLQWQENWTSASGITINDFSSEQKKLANWINKNEDGSFVYVHPDNVFGEPKYKVTSERTNYLYCGETKDNYASGYGILYKRSEGYYGVLNYNNLCYDLLYMGEFKEGRFEGYGIKFNLPDGSAYAFEQVCPYEQGSDEYQYYYLAWMNYAEYEGKFKNGAYNGKGNMYDVDLPFRVSLSAIYPVPNVHDVFYDYTYVGSFDDGELNGKCRIYIENTLKYDGEMKDGEYHGYGKEYYPATGTLKYDGNYKKGRRHGKGTSYDQDGNKVYSGEWKNDDYA